MRFLPHQLARGSIRRLVVLLGLAWMIAGAGQPAVAQGPGKPAIPTPAPVPASPSAPTPTPKAAPTSARVKRQAELDAEPTVMSADAAAALRKSHARDDRYGGATDWRDVPAWRQASFYGLRAEGKVFIFVVDRSGSMEDGDRLDHAKRELIRSIGVMQPPQRFQVIFYNDRATTLGELPKSADFPSKRQLVRWLALIDADGDTDPRAALGLALGQRPDGIFLLSDGAFPDGTPAAIAALNPHKVPIHCVDLAGGAAGDDLKAIAHDSGGQYTGAGR